jgi:hypothetical protein
MRCISTGPEFDVSEITCFEIGIGRSERRKGGLCKARGALAELRFLEGAWNRSFAITL